MFGKKNLGLSSSNLDPNKFKMFGSYPKVRKIENVRRRAFSLFPQRSMLATRKTHKLFLNPKFEIYDDKNHMIY